MEHGILDSLESFGYEGNALKDDKVFQDAVDVGPKSVEFTQLVHWICNELKILCKLENNVNPTASADDSASFMLELSSFLKEIYCPHQSLTDGNVNQRLNSKESRLALLDFLCTELHAARIIAIDCPDASGKGLQVVMPESETAVDLKEMLRALEFSKPPPNITAAQLFGKVDTKLKELFNKVPPKLMSKPLFTGVLTAKQWQDLEKLHNELKAEYRLRREMLLTRLDLTIQSFQWSGKAKQNYNVINQVFPPLRRNLTVEPKVDVADLLAAREDLTILEKTSSSSVRKNTTSKVNKVRIGRVPDRGGRPSEQRAPPPEMPSWQKRTAPRGGGGGGGGHGGGGGRGRGGGERVQGGWSGGRGGQQRGEGRGRSHGGGGGRRGGRGHQEQPYQEGPNMIAFDAAGAYGAGNYTYN